MPAHKQFDVDEALDNAIETFWEVGYQATSMNHLLKRMGIQKGSFYATFSSKHEVYVQAIHRYVRTRFAEFEAEMTGHTPREAITRMIDSVRKDTRGPVCSRGCFVINAALELAPSDDEVGELVRQTLATHQDWIRRLVKEAQGLGEIPPETDASTTAKTLLGLIIAMRVYARAGMPSSYVTALRSQALGLLE